MLAETTVTWLLRVVVIVDLVCLVTVDHRAHISAVHVSLLNNIECCINTSFIVMSPVDQYQIWKDILMRSCGLLTGNSRLGLQSSRMQDDLGSW